MTTSIWPSTHGETPLQHYNSCFTLAHIQNNADACICFHNDHMLKVLSKVQFMKYNASIKSESFKAKTEKTKVEGVDSRIPETIVTMKNQNEYIMTVMKNVLMPRQGQTFDFCDIMDLTCMPQYKFLSAASNPFILDNYTHSNPPTNDKQWMGVIDGCLDFIMHFPMSKHIE